MKLNPHNFKSGHMQYKRLPLAFFRKATVSALVLVMMVAASAAMLLNHSVTTAAAAFSIQNDQPNIGPGIPQGGSNAPKSGASNTKPGSVLFFP